MNKRLKELQNELGAPSVQSVPKIKNIIKTVNERINADPEEKKIYTKKKVFSAVLVAAIIMSLTGLTVLASSIFHWHEMLIEYFHPTEQQIEQLEGNVNIPQATGADNGVTVNVLQTLTDSHGIYVLYEVILPENITITQDLIDKNLRWSSNMLSIDEEESDAQLTVLGGSPSKILSFDKNKMTILMNRTANRKYNKNQHIKLSLKDMCYYVHAEDDILEEVLVPCNIELSWYFDYTDNSTVYNINKPVQIVQNAENTLEKIEISPLSVWITIEGDDVASATKPIIKFKNQPPVQIEPTSDFSTTYNYVYNAENDSGVLTIGYCFDAIYDISDIESITIGNLVIPID